MKKTLGELHREAESITQQSHDALYDWWDFGERSRAALQALFDDPNYDMLQERPDLLHKLLWDDEMKSNSLLRKARRLSRKSQRLWRRVLKHPMWNEPEPPEMISEMDNVHSILKKEEEEKNNG